LQHRDYGRDDDKLCAEQSAHELSWSRNLSITPEQIEKWFGRKIATAGGAGNSGALAVMVVIYIILNIPAWLMMDADSVVPSLFISGIAIVGLARLGRRGDWRDVFKSDKDDDD